MNDIVVFNPKDIQKYNNGKNRMKRIRTVAIIIGITYVIAMTVMYMSNPVNKITVIQGEIADEQSVEGYVIRDETILSTNMVSDIMLTKTEGSRVGKNEVIATYVSKTKKEMETKINESLRKETTELYSRQRIDIDVPEEETELYDWGLDEPVGLRRKGRWLY